MRELIIDSFAGGGGASTGIELALGVSPDIAINHDDVALAMHAANHPNTIHLPHNIWKVDPVAVCNGMPVGLLWASPDCRHFSKAKGGKPVENRIRDLAWVVVRWARQVSPRVIILENVEEFRTWGPLAQDGRPCPDRKGRTFKRWVGELRRLGYKVEWRELRACDYGAPTIRKRLFLIARRDGEPIVWPAPTHGDPKSEAVTSGALKPWRTAAEIIDWSLPTYSIFMTKEEAVALHAETGVRVKRPLQAATMARVAKGVKRYVLDAAKPFIINLTHQGGERSEDVDTPTMTVTGAHRGEKALVVPDIAGPFVTGVGGRMGQSEPRDAGKPAQTVTAKADAVLITPFVTAAQQGGSMRGLDAPLHTVTASKKDQNQVVVPTLIQSGYGERAGQEPRVPGLDKPLGTAVAGGVKHALVAAHLTKFRANSIGSGMDEPAPTVTANSFKKRPGGAAPLGVVSAHLMTMRNAQKPFNEADMPTHTVTSGGARLHLVAAFMAQHNIDGRNGEGNPGRAADEPVSTILQSGSHQGLVAANLLRQFGTGVGSSLEEPTRTVMADGGGKTQLTAAFLSKYYGTDQDPQIEGPLHTATTKDRFGLVTVNIEGQPYVIADIGIRMLAPRELFGAQGFPTTYHITWGVAVKDNPDRGWVAVQRIGINKTEQVRMCGNSVSPVMAKALAGANYTPRDVVAADAPDGIFLEAAE
jgi:DNA (cytosine-5)-methyltransferase 1